jgi:hypothetical protein
MDGKSFFLKVNEYTRVNWEYALEDWKSGVFIALNSSQSSYDAFLSLITLTRRLVPWTGHRLI